MAKQFVGFVPGLMGHEDHIDFSRPSEKFTMLQKAWAEPKLMAYQTADNRVPDYNTMARNVADEIIKQQKATGGNGKIVASSVGAGVLRGALILMAEEGHKMPDVVLIGPVWNIGETVTNMVGVQTVRALLSGQTGPLPMPVSGENAGTFPLNNLFLEQALAAAAKPLPKLPSLTILTGADDKFCNAEGAGDILKSVPAERADLKIWEGGHNVNDAGRDNDILFTLSRTLRQPNMFSKLMNVADRHHGRSIRHRQKNAAILSLENKLANRQIPATDYEMTRARLNIMRRIRVAPTV